MARSDEPGEGSRPPGSDDAGRVFDVVDVQGNTRRFTAEDFDEFWTTSDEHEARRHVALGWQLIDETVGPGQGRGGLEFRMVPTGEGRYQSAPRELPPDNVTTYLLGFLKPGAIGRPAG